MIDDLAMASPAQKVAVGHPPALERRRGSPGRAHTLDSPLFGLWLRHNGRLTAVEGKSGGSNSLGPLGGLVPMQLANTPALRRIFTQAMFSSMPATSATYPLLGGTTSRIPTPFGWR